MRNLLIFLASTFLLPASVIAQNLPSAPQPSASANQQDDLQWDRMTLLDPDSHVSVTSNRGRIRCTNVRVTDDGFSCEFGSIFLPPRTIDLPRSDVREVRLRHDRRNFWIGIGATATAGFIIGATGPNLGDTQSRIGSGTLGAALVGFAASPFVYAVTYWLPGHSIYRRAAYRPLTP